MFGFDIQSVWFFDSGSLEYWIPYFLKKGDSVIMFYLLSDLGQVAGFLLTFLNFFSKIFTIASLNWHSIFFLIVSSGMFFPYY